MKPIELFNSVHDYKHPPTL